MKGSLIERIFGPSRKAEPLEPGLYQSLSPDDAPTEYRLHLRVEPDANGILIINASTVLHLNTSATEHAYQIVTGANEEEAAQAIAERYRVGKKTALKDQQSLREHILTLATTEKLDPVLFLDMDRTEPYSSQPLAPFRLDLALTYETDPDGSMDPLALHRVDRELTTDEWKGILKRAWEAGIPHISFTGGEPSRRQDLPDLITYAEQRGQVTGLITNGRRLSNPEYVNELEQTGLDYIHVALNRDAAESMDGLLAGLKCDIFTTAHIVVEEEPESTFKLLENLYAAGLRDISLAGKSESESTTKALEEARDHAAFLGMDLIWNIPAPYSLFNPISLELHDPVAGAGWAWLYIEPDADVLPSQGIDHILGNALKDPWEVIWDKAASREEPPQT
jgi:MoaA/NifB/PqqE/SkfB family radical SAM enzyme